MIRIGQQVVESDKRNKGKRGISFVQLHRGHKHNGQYMFIESPRHIGKFK